jgi:hypothetical protein
MGSLTAATDVSPRDEQLPFHFSLSQNYPNPFNPTTVIRFTVPKYARATLTILNTLGQEVATLYDRETEPGTPHQVQFDASGLASGVYYSRLSCDGNVRLKHMVMIK